MISNINLFRCMQIYLLILLSCLACMKIQAQNICCGSTCGTCGHSYSCEIYGTPGQSTIYFTENLPAEYRVNADCYNGCGGVPETIGITGDIPSGLTQTTSVVDNGFTQQLVLYGVPTTTGNFQLTFYSVSDPGTLCLTITLSISESASPDASGIVVPEDGVTVRCKHNDHKKIYGMNVLKIKESKLGVPPKTFRIYRKGKLIKEIRNHGKKVKVVVGPNRNPKKKYVYYVHSVDKQGIESAPTIVKIRGSDFNL